jgi:uncharacterized membrane protein YbaN (DUF454 family)
VEGKQGILPMAASMLPTSFFCFLNCAIVMPASKRKHYLFSNYLQKNMLLWFLQGQTSKENKFKAITKIICRWVFLFQSSKEIGHTQAAYFPKAKSRLHQTLNILFIFIM